MARVLIDLPPNLDDIRRARENIRGAAIRTPLLPLNVDHPTPVFLKLENLQRIGSFKIRGAANVMATLAPEELRRGVVTASAGNMAQGVAWRARELGIPCTVVAPDHAPAAKLRAIERLGAAIVLVPFARWWQAMEEGTWPGSDATFVHPCRDPRVMAGNGAIGLEILEDLPDVGAILIPWGGGGLACGIAAAVRALKPECRLFACEVATAAPLAAALSAGQPVAIDHQPSWVDGIGGKGVFPEMFERARALLDGSLVVSLDDVAAAVRVLVERNRVVAEGGGACPVAVALSGQAGPGPIVCVVSGGNLNADRLAEILRSSGTANA